MEIREDAVQGLNDSGGTDNIGDRDQSWLFDGVDLWGPAILYIIDHSAWLNPNWSQGSKGTKAGAGRGHANL